MANPLKYRLLSLDLSQARSDQLFEIQGEVLVYLDPPDGGALQIRLTESNADQLIVNPQTRISFPFKRLYISNAAIPGKIAKLYIASPANAVVDPKDVSVNTITELEHVTLIDTLTEVANVTSVDLVDAVTNVNNVAKVSQIGATAGQANLDNVTHVATVDSVTNVPSVDLVDAVTTVNNVAKISQIGATAGQANLDNVTHVATVDSVTNVPSVDLVDAVTTVNNVAKVSQIGAIAGQANIDNVTHVATVDDVTRVNKSTKLWNSSIVFITDVSSLMVNLPNIQSQTFTNKGLSTVFISGTDPALITDSVILFPGETIKLNHYTGNIYGICAPGESSKVIQWCEYS